MCWPGQTANKITAEAFGASLARALEASSALGILLAWAPSGIINGASKTIDLTFNPMRYQVRDDLKKDFEISRKTEVKFLGCTDPRLGGAPCKVSGDIKECISPSCEQVAILQTGTNHCTVHLPLPGETPPRTITSSKVVHRTSRRKLSAESRMRFRPSLATTSLFMTARRLPRVLQLRRRRESMMRSLAAVLMLLAADQAVVGANTKQVDRLHDWNRQAHFLNGKFWDHDPEKIADVHGLPFSEEQLQRVASALEIYTREARIKYTRTWSLLSLLYFSSCVKKDALTSTVSIDLCPLVANVSRAWSFAGYENLSLPHRPQDPDVFTVLNPSGAVDYDPATGPSLQWQRRWPCRPQE